MSTTGGPICFVVGRRRLAAAGDGGSRAGGKLRLVAGQPAVRDDGGDGWEALALPGERWGGRRLTLREGRHHTPRFSPDGRFVSFVCDRVDDIDVVVVSVDGTWQRVLNRGSDFPMDPSWSPDGTRLVWHAYPNTLMPWDQSALVVAEVESGNRERSRRQRGRRTPMRASRPMDTASSVFAIAVAR